MDDITTDVTINLIDSRLPVSGTLLINTELMVPFHLKITELLIKLSQNQKL